MKFFRKAEIEYTPFSVRWWGECWAGSLTFMDGIGYDVCRALCCVENIEKFSLMTRYPKEVDFFLQCLLLTTHELMSCEEKLEQETTLGKVARVGVDVRVLTVGSGENRSELLCTQRFFRAETIPHCWRFEFRYSYLRLEEINSFSPTEWRNLTLDRFPW